MTYPLDPTNYIDNNEAYFRLLSKCRCGCTKHCGHSCMTDDCDCFECTCPSCIDKLYKGNAETDK